MPENLKFKFGDISNSVIRSSLDNFKTQEEYWNLPVLKNLKDRWNLKYFIALKQMHSNLGYIITEKNLNNFTEKLHEGDYLITNLKNTALGVYTADCLAIIFYDKINNVIGICHAGWPGSVNQIVKKTFQVMQENFNTQAKNIKIIFSPSAKKCCYIVSEDFRKNLINFKETDKFFIKKNNNLYFDLTLFNILELNKLGINTKSINLDFNTCTICDINQCSYRRDKENSKRQLSVVSLI